MAELPSDTIFDILSRLPVKLLARFRCVSKTWCAYIDDDYFGILQGERAVEELTPFMYDPSLSRLGCIIGLNIIKSEEGNTTLGAKKCMSFESGSWHITHYFGGSCNGLLYLSSHHIPPITVIHPLRKEFYELPPLKRLYNGSSHVHRDAESRGLGFDVSTNTFKMVCVLRRGYISKDLYTMVHVLGVDSSWREIPQVPPYPTSGDGIFAHGCLYWLVSYKDLRQSSSEGELICFDVSNEEFTLIYPQDVVAQ